MPPKSWIRLENGLQRTRWLSLGPSRDNSRGITRATRELVSQRSCTECFAHRRVNAIRFLFFIFFSPLVSFSLLVCEIERENEREMWVWLWTQFISFFSLICLLFSSVCIIFVFCHSYLLTYTHRCSPVWMKRIHQLILKSSLLNVRSFFFLLIPSKRFTKDELIKPACVLAIVKSMLCRVYSRKPLQSLTLKSAGWEDKGRRVEVRR